MYVASALSETRPRPNGLKNFFKYTDLLTTCIILGLGLSFKMMFLPESCVRAVSDLRNIFCSVLLAFFNYITKICHIITIFVNAPIPVHLSASASMVRPQPRPRTLWPRPRRLGLGLGLVISGLVNIPAKFVLICFAVISPAFTLTNAARLLCCAFFVVSP